MDKILIEQRAPNSGSDLTGLLNSLDANEYFGEKSAEEISRLQRTIILWSRNLFGIKYPLNGSYATDLKDFPNNPLFYVWAAAEQIDKDGSEETIKALLVNAANLYSKIKDYKDTYPTDLKLLADNVPLIKELANRLKIKPQSIPDTTLI